jgi:hypothetical protein|tara:strand:+ start:2970 stop:3911 length:942 start_codon:yes stop_codon:yes gene_type:complete
MSLTVTVQKGHDFSSGNITRAALNAGATPTIAVTGSVGTSELAADSVTATELKDDASTDSNRAVTTNHIRDLAVTEGKLANDAVALTKIKALTGQGKLIVGGSGGDPEELDAKTSNNLLIGNGTTLLSLPLDTSNSDISVAQDGTDIAITISNDKVTVDKIAHQSNPGVLAYGASGVPEAVTTSNSGQVLITQGSSAPALKWHHKVVPVSSTAVIDTWLTGAHGITCTGTNYPHLVCWYFECTTAEHGYAIGDRLYATNQEYRDSAHINTVYVDGTNVGINLNLLPYLREKTNNTNQEITAANWKVVAIVSEI